MPVFRHSVFPFFPVAMCSILSFQFFVPSGWKVPASCKLSSFSGRQYSRASLFNCLLVWMFIDRSLSGKIDMIKHDKDGELDSIHIHLKKCGF